MSDPVDDKAGILENSTGIINIKTEEATGLLDQESPVAGENAQPDDLHNVTGVVLGQADGDNAKPIKSLHQWHDFESQYSLALGESVVIEREQWGGQCEFLMSCIASAVGLGNIWRFPLIAGQNGGGAFLIPYIIVLTLIGRPLCMLENCLGQFCSNGPIKIWEMAPGFRGVGIAATVASFFLSTFYCVIMGWAILYLFYSMFPDLPWTRKETISFTGINLNPNGSSERFFNQLHLGVPDKFHDETDFKMGKGLDGPPVLNLAIAVFVAWFFVWALMVRGVSGSGKIAYFTALFPYFVLVILLAGGLTLPGCGKGIVYFFTPTWIKILDPQTWFQAVGQCFFSLGISFGSCMMFSSFNVFHHKVGRDVLIVSIMDTFTSVLAGISMFSLLGNIAETSSDPNVTIESLALNPGAGLAFVTFPNVLKAFGKYPGPNCISALFFFMLIVLALGSANGIVGTTVTVICDYFPKWKRWIVVTVMCCLCFLFGLVYVCPTGSYLIDMVDSHGLVLVIYMVAIFETLGVSAVYGLKNISNDLEFMLDGRVNMYWLVCWASLPVILIVLFVFYLVTYQRDKKWPDVAFGCAWALTATCWLILPIAAIVVIQTRKSHSLMHRIKASFLPTRRWGPKDLTVRDNWRRWKKTKPTEFKITGQILVALRLRNFFAPTDPLDFWSDDLASNYQTRSNSKAPSGTTVDLGVVVASENP